MLDRLAQTPSGKLMDEKGNADARKRRDEVLQRKILPENTEKQE